MSNPARAEPTQLKLVSPVGILVLSEAEHDISDNKTIVDVDIVFVHGLQGFSSTWSSKPTNGVWPRDLLPSSIQNARTMAFGYDPTGLSATSESGMSKIAYSLLGELFLTRYGQEERHRPLIFIGHNTGGQVIKRALCIAQTCKEYTELHNSTIGILFLGVLNRDPTPDSYDAAAQRLAAVTTMKDHEDLALALKAINLEFVKVCSHYTLVSFYEEKEIPGLGILIGKRSATMENSSEIAIIGLDADHNDMCKFEDPNSRNYKTLIEQLQKVIQKGSDGTKSLTRHESNEEFHVPPWLDETYNSLSKQTLKRIYSDEVNPRKRVRPDVPPVVGEGVPDHRANNTSQISGIQYNRPHFANHAYFQRDAALRRIRTALTSRGERSFGLHGLGGVGKTQLVLKYINEYSYSYRHIFWVVADSDVKISNSFQDLALRMYPSESPRPTREENIQAVRDWLSSNDEYLLVFDNAEEPDILKPYWPTVAGSVITTSRNPQFVEQRITATGMELEALEPAEGAEYLFSQLAHPTGDDEDEEDEVQGTQLQGLRTAKSISQLFGGHPLALSHMASWIRDTDSTLEEFLKEYKDNNATITLEYQASGATFDYQRSYASCWSLAFNELKDTPAARLLGILALLDPDSIPEDLLQGFARSTSEAIPPLKNTATHRLATASLRRHALMRKDKRRGTISVHRLVQDASIRYLQSTDQLQQAFEDATTCLSRVYPRQKQGGSMFESFRDCKLFTPQLLSLEKNYNNIKECEAETNRKGTLRAFPLLAELLCHCGWYLYETGTSKAALQVLHTAKDICDEFYGTRPDPLTALVYSNIGVVLSNQNQAAEALEIGMRALTIRRRCLPGGHFQIGESLNNCAGGYHDLDQLEDAQQLFEESVSIQENNPVRNERLLEGAYSNLGRNLMALRRFEEAEEVFEKARSLHSALSADLFFVSLTLFLVGNLRMYQGRWEEAEREHEQALKVRLVSLDPQHKCIGVSLHQLARLLHRRGLDHGEEGAIQLLRNALGIFERDPSEPGLVPRSKFLLSLILARVANRTGSIAAAEESQKHREKAIFLVKQEPLFTGMAYAEEREWDMLVQYEYR